MFSFNLNNAPTAGGYLSMYNTLINYKWGTTVKDNIAYLKNFGASKYNAEMNSGKGIRFNGVDQQIKVPMPYTLVGNLVCNYTGTETYDGSQGDWTSKYNQYIDVKPYTSYRVTVNIVSANNIAYAGIRFEDQNFWTFDYYGITDIGEQEFVYTSGSMTHVYTRWFVKSDFVGEFGVTQIQEIQQDKLSILYRDKTGNLIQETNTTPMVRYRARKGTVKDLYIFTDTLTDAEITKCSLQPNEFFQDVRDGVIDNCILNMPMESLTGYVRDYASDYTIGDELSGNVNFYDDSWWAFNGGVSVSNGQLVINPDNDFDSIQKYNYFPTGVPILITIKLDECDSFDNSGIRIGGPFKSFSSLGIKSIGISQIITTFINLDIRIWGKKGYITKIDYISFKQVSGVYPIKNYTSGCINNTSHLNYGTQELKFLRDGPWRGDLSKYLEGNGNGYADTGWTPTGDYQIEVVYKAKYMDKHQQNGVHSSDDNTNLFYGLWVDNRLVVSIGSKFVLTPIKDGEIAHIVFVADNGTSSVYVNGELKDTGTIADLSHSFTLGAKYDLSFYGWNDYGETRLFKVHTEPQDPSDLYNQAQQKGLLS